MATCLFYVNFIRKSIVDVILKKITLDDFIITAYVPAERERKSINIPAKPNTHFDPLMSPLYYHKFNITMTR